MPVSVEFKSNGNRFSWKSMNGFRWTVTLFMVVFGGYEVKQIAGPYIQQLFGTAPPPVTSTVSVPPSAARSAVTQTPKEEKEDEEDPCADLARRITILENRFNKRSGYRRPAPPAPPTSILRRDYVVTSDWRLPMLSYNHHSMPPTE